jgi:heptosyltransferase II
MKAYRMLTFIFVSMQKFLVIQTAFIGDAVLATGILEKIHATYPNATIDYLVRNGNQSLFKHHPFITEILIWDKQQNKYANLFTLITRIRKNKYDVVINVQRFAATGFITALSNAKLKIGFTKNPFSFLFDIRVKHNVNKGLHEIERNQMLIENICEGEAFPPKLYPTKQDEDSVAKYINGDFITIAPASVWFTKQFPSHQWLKFINELPENIIIYLLGGKTDFELCEILKENSKKMNVINLAGHLNFLQSAALMKHAKMNYVNDSAPMHFASAVNAPTCAVYCSTIPEFGFGPLSDKSYIVEIENKLTCRPCGLHGKKDCPQGHFNCANEIKTSQLLQVLNN